MIRATARGMQHQKATNLRCFHSLASPACHVSHCVLRTWQAIKVTHRIPRQPRAPLRAPDQSVRKMAKISSEIDGMDKNLDLAGDFNGSKGAAAAAPYGLLSPFFVSHWPSIDDIWIVLATPGTGLGGKNRIYPSLRSCLGAIVW